MITSYKIKNKIKNCATIMIKFYLLFYKLNLI